MSVRQVKGRKISLWVKARLGSIILKYLFEKRCVKS
jgi:hypothetical protein